MVVHHHTPPSPPPLITVGIDIGSDATKIVLGSSLACEIVRSDVAGHTTPTAVSFQGKTRHMGETANVKGSPNAIVQINRLLCLSLDALKQQQDLLSDFYMFSYQTTSQTAEGFSEITVQVDYNYNNNNGESKQQTFSASAILAMLLGKIRTSVNATIDRLTNNNNNNTSHDKNNNSKVRYVLSICPGTTRLAQTQVLDAAYAAGLYDDDNDNDNDGCWLVETPAAYAMAYQRKFPNLPQNKKVLMVDMGHAQTTVSIVQMNPSINDNEGEETTTTTKDKDGNNNKPNFTILACNCHDSLGAGNVDVRLWHYFQSTLQPLKEVKKKSRAGQRLLAGTHKLKHLLSQLPEGTVTVENVGLNNDTDITLTATRTLLAELCEPDAQTLTELLQTTMEQAGVAATDIGSVEILGGGCRIPWVQKTIQQQVVSKAEEEGMMILSKSLDDTSAALGAALVGEIPADINHLILVQPAETKQDIIMEQQERRNKLRQAEQEMAALDLEQKMIADARNQLESHVLELRSAKNSKHAALLPSSDSTLDTLLDQVEDWIFTSPEANEDATLEGMQAKLQDTLAQTQELCHDYFAAVRQENLQKEQEMEQAAKQAQMEMKDDQNNNGNGGDDDDHDNRRLPKKRRMEIVMKNKEEANELFKDGNWRFAAARYQKALTHCAKFVDLSPQDIQEVNALKVTLNLNLALAYTKLENLDQALRVCNEALVLSGDTTNVKALYRRASIYYEKKNWDMAKQDIQKAIQFLSPQEDKALKKLSDRIELQLKKQKDKEKKMAAKMFG